MWEAHWEPVSFSEKVLHKLNMPYCFRIGTYEFRIFEYWEVFFYVSFIPTCHNHSHRKPLNFGAIKVRGGNNNNNSSNNNEKKKKELFYFIRTSKRTMIYLYALGRVVSCLQKHIGVISLNKNKAITGKQTHKNWLYGSKYTRSPLIRLRTMAAARILAINIATAQWAIVTKQYNTLRHLYTNGVPHGSR